MLTVTGMTATIGSKMSEVLIPVVKKMRIFTAYNQFAEEGELHRAQVYDGNIRVHEVYGVSEHGVLAEATEWVYENFTVPDSYTVHNRLPEG